MRHITLITLIVLANCNLYAQNPIDNRDSLRVGITKELNIKGVKDFFFFIQTSPSVIAAFPEGNLKYSYVDFNGYVFWNENSKTYVKKFDYRGLFEIVELENFIGVDFAFENSDSINSEIVLPYQTLSDGETLITPIEYRYNFYFSLGSTKFEKQFSPHGLIENDYDDPKMANKNYVSNNKLKMIQLYKICMAASEIFK